MLKGLTFKASPELEDLYFENLLPAIKQLKNIFILTGHYVIQDYEKFIQNYQKLLPHIEEERKKQKVILVKQVDLYEKILRIQQRELEE